jgi:Protein of unknown function (DUF1153)
MTKATNRKTRKTTRVYALHEIRSMTELPPLNTRRWVARRKAAVVAAVLSGMITLEEACRRYQDVGRGVLRLAACVRELWHFRAARWLRLAAARLSSLPTGAFVTRPNHAGTQRGYLFKDLNC